MPLYTRAVPDQLFGFERSAALLRCARARAIFRPTGSWLTRERSNDQTVVPPLMRAVSRSYEMMGAKAYLHQYATYGIGEDDFRHSLATVEHSIAAYQQLRQPA
jgi:hypothetical protein